MTTLHRGQTALVTAVMATSSSEGSCTAPADFQLSSELDDVSSRLSVTLLKCSLCYNSRRVFYCKQCIQNGDFIHSTSVYSERYIFLLHFKTVRSRIKVEYCADVYSFLASFNAQIWIVVLLYYSSKETSILLHCFVNAFFSLFDSFFGDAN